MPEEYLHKIFSYDKYQNRCYHKKQFIAGKKDDLICDLGGYIDILITLIVNT